MTDMTISVTELKRCVVIKLGGRIDSSKAPELENALRELENQGHYRLVLDMADVEYVSSAFLRVVISHMKSVKRWNRGNLYLAALPPRIEEVFDLAGLLPLFKVYPTVTEAVGDW